MEEAITMIGYIAIAALIGAFAWVFYTVISDNEPENPPSGGNGNNDGNSDAK